jgi:hypothetical protein
MGTWLSNPKIKIRLNSKDKNGNQIGKPGELRELFIGIYIRDSRMTMGFDYYKDPLYATPLAFDVVTEEELKCSDPEKRKTVDRASYPPFRNAQSESVKQPPYNFGTTQVELMLRLDEDYYIVPSLYKRNQPGTYFISVYADVNDFFLEGGVALASEHEPMQIGSKPAQIEAMVGKSSDKLLASTPKELKMSVSQFYEKKESLRERLTSECKRLNLIPQTISSIFSGGNTLAVPTFKRRMVDLGFNLADFPDDDLVVLDEDNSGSISREELLSFLKTGIAFVEGSDIPEPQQPPIDDLLFKAADMEGILSINVVSGRRLREATTWISSATQPNGSAAMTSASSKLPMRSVFKYDAVAAEKEIKVSTSLAVSPNFTIEESSGKRKADDSSSDEKLASLTKPTKVSTQNEDDLKSVVTSRYTANPADLKAGNEAGLRLHSDVILQKGEVSRTTNLQTLRRLKQRSSNSTTEPSESDNILRLKTKPLGSKTKRDILKDRETMSWLAYNPQTVSSAAFRVPISASLPMAASKHSSKLSQKPQKLQSHLDDIGAPDLWDYLISTVITVATSRDKKFSSQSQSLLDLKSNPILSRQSFSHFEPSATALQVALNNPSVLNKLVKKGSIPTPRDRRHSSGVASVSSIRNPSPSKQRNLEMEAKDKLKAIEEEQLESFEEVYRRLILVPTIDQSSAGSKASNLVNTVNDEAFVKTLFRRFDKNDNGLISYDEFQNAMKSMKIDMTSDECSTLFNRLDSKTTDSNIDMEEFSSFFNDCVHGILSSSEPNSTKPIEQTLVDIRSRLLPMYVQDESAATSGRIFKSDVIFNDLKVCSAAVNVDKLKALGVSLTIPDVARVSRVFKESITSFHEFMSHSSLDLDTGLQWFDATLLRCLVERSGSGLFTAATTSKLWVALAGSESEVSFDRICQYFSQMIEDSIHHQEDHNSNEHRHNCALVVSGHSLQSIGGSIVESPREISASSKSLFVNSKAIESEEKYCSVMGVKVDILSRIVLDAIFTSHWNRSPEKTRSADVKSKSTISNTLSYSGFEAYIRCSHVNSLERKLRYLLHVGLNVNAGAVYLLVHVYFSSSRDEVVVLAHDPIIGEVYKLQWKENISSFPSRSKLLQWLQPKIKKVEDVAKKLGTSATTIYNARSWQLYNPVDTPCEDQAITEMLKRLRLVQSSGTKPSSIMLAEDPSFILELKKLLDSMANDVPFFSILNDVSLSFEIDNNALSSTKTIEKIVFSSVRKNKALLKFITNVNSNIEITLSTYNGDKRQVMSWREMVNYLLDYRNPFVTIQLLPKFLEPDEYFYYPTSAAEPFSGDETDKFASDSIRRGETDIDGGKYPTWNSKFQMSYKPPKLSFCKILSKETAKLTLDGKAKYVLIMVRQATKQGKKSFLFLTIYDPRSSTEYQCGVHQKSELYKTICDEQISMVLDSKEDGKLVELLLKTSNLLEDAIAHNQIIVGPAITPRLLINVYNQRGRQDELLGTSQVSISSVLSGTGVIKPRWITLNYTSESDAKATMNAGEVLIDISFRKLAEIEAERKSGLEHLEKLKVKAKEERKMSKSIILPTLGPADQAARVSPKMKPAAPVSNNANVVKTTVSLKDDPTSEQIKQMEAKLSELEALRAENERLKSSSKIADSASSKVNTSTPTDRSRDARLTLLEESVKQLDASKAKLEQDNAQLMKELSMKQQLLDNEAKSRSEAESLRFVNQQLQNEIEKIRASRIEEVQPAKKSGQLDKQPNVADPQPPITSLAAAVIGPSGDIVLSKDNFNEDLNLIINIFINRHEKRLLSGTAVGSGPLDTFERLLQCHSIENLVNSKQVVNAFADAAIDLSIESAELLLQRVGKPLSATRDHVTYQSLITFLKRRIASGVEVTSPAASTSKAGTTGRLSIAKSVPPKEMNDKQRLSATSAIPQSKSMKTEPLATDNDMAAMTSKSDKPPISDKSAVVGQSKETSKAQQMNEPTHSITSKSRLAETMPASSKVRLETNDTSVAQTRPIAATQPMTSTEVNWDEVPLPSKSWERRVDSRNGKVSFHHELQSHVDDSHLIRCCRAITSIMRLRQHNGIIH